MSAEPVCRNCPHSFMTGPHMICGFDPPAGLELGPDADRAVAPTSYCDLHPARIYSFVNDWMELHGQEKKL